MKNIVFSIRGGLGKHIAATAVCRAIKNTYSNSRLYVLAAYPEPFLNNPHVYRVYRHGCTPYFYEDVIEKNDVTMLLHDPYDCEQYVLGKKHLIQSWCDIHKIEYTGEMPEIFLNEVEITNFRSQLSFSKPLLVSHPFGGPENQEFAYNWNRDLSFSLAQEIVNTLCHQYDIIQIRNQQQPQLQNASGLNTSIRSLFCVLAISHRRLLIDSFSQHASAALNLSSTVCWITNSPKSLGYSLHQNIESNIPKNEKKIHPIDSVLEKYYFSGERQWQFPYSSTDEIFDIAKILETF